MSKTDGSGGGTGGEGRGESGEGRGESGEGRGENVEDRPSFLETDHAASWSANLEADRYADDRETLVEHALLALDHTEPGHHVNLVTHPAHGDPDAYLEAAIGERYPDADATVVDQCGCGGYVYRVER